MFVNTRTFCFDTKLLYCNTIFNISALFLNNIFYFFIKKFVCVFWKHIAFSFLLRFKKTDFGHFRFPAVCLSFMLFFEQPSACFHLPTVFWMVSRSLGSLLAEQVVDCISLADVSSARWIICVVETECFSKAFGLD